MVYLSGHFFEWNPFFWLGLGIFLMGWGLFFSCRCADLTIAQLTAYLGLASTIFSLAIFLFSVLEVAVK